jgi:surface protein
MPIPTSLAPQSITAVTLNVSSGSPSTTVSQTFNDPVTLASLQIGSNSIPITNQAILSRFATPGLQCSNGLSLTYSGYNDGYNDVNSVAVSTPALVNDFVATPITLSNFGPSFTYNFVSNGTFTLPEPTPSNNSPGTFSYSVVGPTDIVSISSNVVTIISAGSTTIRAIKSGAGYTSTHIEANVIINPIAPTFSNNNSSTFTIPDKNVGDAPFMPSYPTSNSLGAFTYTSSNMSVATVNATTGLVTFVAQGTTTITATQAAAGGYTSRSATGNLTVNTILQQKGFFQVTDSAFTNLNFDSGMTTLFTEWDSISSLISMPNNNFTFNGTPYSVVYLSSEGALYFGTQQQEYNFGQDNQLPISSFRFFGGDHMSTGSYNFDSNNTKLLIKLTGYFWADFYKTFTIKVIIEQSGNITTNYTIDSTYNSDPIIIGYVGSNSDTTSDDIFLTLGGVTFNGITYEKLFSLLNGKTIQYYNNLKLIPNLGPFTLPSGINVYQYPPISVLLTPPTSDNISSAFTFSSSNLNVATISIVEQGVSNITVVGPGTTIITATQAASDDYSISSVSATLVVTAQTPSWTSPFSLPSDLNLYQGQPITRTLTIPTSSTSSSLGSFTVSSNNLDVATINNNDPNGPTITVVGPGTCVITATQNPSGTYYSLSQSVTLNIISIILDSSNNKTIKCVGSISTPIYIIQASPRGTSEWFAIVTQQAKTSITSYAKGEAAGITAFTKVISSNESVEVPFKNIVTSLMTDMSVLFSNASDFNSDISSWDTFNVVDMNFMFSNASAFNQDIGYWNMSKITSMFGMFYGASAFNQDIGYYPSVSTTAWNTSKVTSMDYMFSGASAFNNGGSPNIGNWNTSLVTSMYGMFIGASAFNQDIGYYPSVSTTAWNTSNVTLMGEMFLNASLFNNGGSPNIGNWNTSLVTNMDSMFQNASAFNQDISKWNVNNVTPKPPINFSLYTSLPISYMPNWSGLVLDTTNNKTIKYLFSSIPSTPIYITQASPRGTSEWFAIVTNEAAASITSYANGEAAGITAFTKVISSNESVEVPFKNIVTSLMTDMSVLFSNASDFNSDISSWDTSNVTNMSYTFMNATAFNQNISSWNTSKVTSMSSLFNGVYDFNSDISSWNTSNVTNMSYTFMNATAFNQNISSWNTSKVTSMSNMFSGALVFNQNIGSWNTSNVIDMSYMFFSALVFNQNIGSWTTSKVTTMNLMFTYASTFNNNGSDTIGLWNTSNVTSMNRMFDGTSVFNQNISAWVVTKVSPKPPPNFRNNSALTFANSPVWV